MPKKVPPADPQACDACRFMLANQTDEFGYCRRYPPTASDNEDGVSTTVWPIVSASEWCGEFCQKTH
jgi:hypothetical protein